jgi:hypothetical protein
MTLLSTLVSPSPEPVSNHNWKKLKAFSKPRNQKDVHRFVGMVNFYHDLYPKWAKILAPLTDYVEAK